MLHDGSIAEMKTGEGKTLVSTLAAYLNALTGEGVHGRPFESCDSFGNEYDMWVCGESDRFLGK